MEAQCIQLESFLSPLNLVTKHLLMNCTYILMYTVCGVLISWKARKGLGILPECYPNPPITTAVMSAHVHNPAPVNTTSVSTRTPLPTKDFVVREFPTLFDGMIRAMDGEQISYPLVTPFCITSPRSIPFAYRDKLAAELDLLQQQHIIALITTPTDWCAPIVVTPKKNSDSTHMCVDLSHLNCFVRRERYQSPSPAEAVADMVASNAKFLDARKGHHQCLLDEESQLLLLPLADSSICVPHMGYHQSQSTMTDAWLKPLLDFRDSVRLLMILSYMIVMLLNMLIMLEPSSKDVWTNRFHST